ncbi:MAG: YggT family protein [Treponema sp.]|jgi:YggT family protein|nr:YggT family protein [Treponema sp.]
MNTIFTLLASLTSIYLLLICIRIILTWFSGISYSKPVAVLSAVTDPYLGWFRRFSGLRLSGVLDLSPIVAMAVLSIANSVFLSLANYGYVTLGFVFALIVNALWSAVSFMLGFLAIILGLRLFAYLTRQNIFSPFWKTVDAISQPVLYRINRFFFGGRSLRYQTVMIISLAIVLSVWIAGRFAIAGLSALLLRLPL